VLLQVAALREHAATLVAVERSLARVHPRVRRQRRRDAEALTARDADMRLSVRVLERVLAQRGRGGEGPLALVTAVRSDPGV